MIKCNLCNDEAIAIFYFSKGCICSNRQIQPLCHQHIIKATPKGCMNLMQDLTIDMEFTKEWYSNDF